MTRYQRTLLLLALPFLAFIVAFYYVPLLGWSMAFVSYKPGMNVLSAPFVGFKKFMDIFTFNKDFAKVMVNTLAMSFLNLLCSPLPIVLAIAVSQIRSAKYRRVVQTLTSLPNFISWVIVFGVSYAFFSVDDGVLNRLLFAMGWQGKPTQLLGDNNATWFFQTFLLVWKTVGWNAIIYFGAIAGIDQELYEAAQIDGAGRWQQIRFVTIPGLMPTFVVLLLLQVGYILGDNFEQIYVFHNNLVHRNIQTLDYYVYVIGIKRFDFSLATAIGMFKSVVSVIMLFSCNLISRKTTGQSLM